MKEAASHTVNGRRPPAASSRSEAVREYHDVLAPEYDDHFSRNGSGDWIRRRFQGMLLERFKPGDRVLELNCGTGTDAIFLASHGIHVTATDISPGMVEITQEKARRLGLDSLISTAVIDSAHLEDLGDGTYDGAFSNFDGLNYLEDVGTFADRIGALLKPGAPLLCTVLNKVCLWEVLYFAATMRPRRALRRITRRAEELMAAQKPLALRLYFPRDFAAYFSRDFLTWKTTGFGLLLPPAGFQWYHSARKRILETLELLEGGIAGIYPAYNLCDHYVVELRKRARPAAKPRAMRFLREALHMMAMQAYVRRRTLRVDQTHMFGFSLRVPPKVFHPRLFRSSRVIGKYLQGEDLRGKTLLDMGCGSGILSLIAARGGAEVISLDINPGAVQAARLNAAENGLAGRVRVFQSDLFETIPAGRQFDVIVWNPPFYPEEPTDNESRAWKGGGEYRVIEEFAESAGRYLCRGGKVIIVLSSDVDVERILSFFRSRGWTRTRTSSRRFLFETLSTYEIRAAE